MPLFTAVDMCRLEAGLGGGPALGAGGAGGLGSRRMRGREEGVGQKQEDPEPGIELVP